MTVRAEINSSPTGPGPKSGLPPRGVVRLRALVLIRWAAVAGQFFTAAVVQWGLGFGLPVLAVGGTIALSALLNLTVSLGRPASARIDDREATLFLAFDILQLAVLLYLTGGLLNPFALLLLAPVAIGATILSLTSNIALSLLTIVSIAVLGWFAARKKLAHYLPAMPIFTVINLWIIASWHDWGYGGSFATRPLVESSPLVALGLAGALWRSQEVTWTRRLCLGVCLACTAYTFVLMLGYWFRTLPYIMATGTDIINSLTFSWLRR